MGVGRLIARRLAQMVPVLLGVTFLTFLILNLLPGNVAVAILGSNATPASIASLDHQLHLDRPILSRYGSWLWQALHGNLGSSLLTHQSVVYTIRQRVPVSLEILILGLVIALLLAIPFAVLAARFRNRLVDRLIGMWAFSGLSIPPFLLGLVLILIAAVDLRWVPATGFVPLSAGLASNLRTAILPAITLSFGGFAVYLRLLRSEMVEQLNDEDYVLTARAKGASENRILLRHVLRNSMFGLITAVGVDFGRLLGGAVIVETVFALPGVGQLLITSIYQRDAPVVQGVVVLIALVVVVVNLVVDVLYSVIDPRVRHGALHS